MEVCTKQTFFLFFFCTFCKLNVVLRILYLYDSQKNTLHIYYNQQDICIHLSATESNHTALVERTSTNVLHL